MKYKIHLVSNIISNLSEYIQNTFNCVKICPIYTSKIFNNIQYHIISQANDKINYNGNQYA